MVELHTGKLWQHTNSSELSLLAWVHSCEVAARAFDGRCSYRSVIGRGVISWRECGIGRAIGICDPPVCTHQILIECVEWNRFAIFVILGDGYTHSKSLLIHDWWLDKRPHSDLRSSDCSLRVGKAGTRRGWVWMLVWRTRVLSDRNLRHWQEGYKPSLNTYLVVSTLPYLGSA
jgi:hypothetical protein